MKKIRVLIGIGFFLIIATILIDYNQKCTNISNTSIKDSDSSIVIFPKTAVTTNYELDYNFTWGGSGTDSGSDIVLDDLGNVYITGNTQSFGAGLNDAFVAKFNSITKECLFNITWGGIDTDYGRGILLDDSGDVYITGTNYSFSAGGYDAIVAKFNSTTGKSLLNISWDAGSDDQGSDIALDKSGNIYIIGSTNGIGAGGYDAFVAKFNSTSGKSLLNITWGNNGNDYGYDIALDDSGDVYITGDTQNFGVYGDDVFVAKFNSTSGKSLLNITWGYSDYVDSGSGIALDKSGNIYITGNTYGFSPVYTDAFIAKFDSTTGESLLNITWDGNNYDYGSDITLDDLGNIYIIGQTVPLASTDIVAYIAKYDSSGKYLLTIFWGGEDEEYGNGIALDDSGNIYITGTTYSFGAGSNDAFVVKYNAIQVYIPPSDDDDDDDNDEVSPIIISGYDLLFLIGFLGLSVVFLIKKRLK